MSNSSSSQIVVIISKYTYTIAHRIRISVLRVDTGTAFSSSSVTHDTAGSLMLHMMLYTTSKMMLTAGSRHCTIHSADTTYCSYNRVGKQHVQHTTLEVLFVVLPS
jgi:hypothetical protein